MSRDNSSRKTIDRLTTDRRRVLQALGVGALAATAGCVSDDDSQSDGEPTIDPTFGYPGTSEDEVPDSLSPDHTVELHADEEKFVMQDGRPAGARFGVFSFEQAGLHVDPGDVVHFQLASPDHTITALHPSLGRQQRVPDGVPGFSSPVIGGGGFWLYEFEEPGVYDLVCSPHEIMGMAMRVVVGEETEPVVRGEGRPPELLSGALLGTGIPGEDGSPDLGVEPLAPGNIVDQGEVHTEDLPLDLAIPFPEPTPPSQI